VYFYRKKGSQLKKVSLSFFLKMEKLKIKLGTARGEGNARCVFVPQKPLALSGGLLPPVKSLINPSD
jgi:hypothetical protein